MAIGARDFLPLLLSARGVAAGAVFLSHLEFAAWGGGESLTSRLMARGSWGVTLFFVLSGFLLTRPWVAAARGSGAVPDVRRYAAHRAVRILPAYWVALVVVLLTTGAGASLAAMVANGLLLQVYTGALLPGFVQTWSLCTEVAFYVVLPLLAPIVYRRGRGPAMTILGIGVAMSLAMLTWSALDPTGPVGAAHLWLPGTFLWFAGGMVLAEFETEVRGGALPGILRKPSVWLAIAVGLYAATALPQFGEVGLAQLSTVQFVGLHAMFACSAVALLTALLLPGAQGTFWGVVMMSRPMQWLGRISYAVFLWQMLISIAAYRLLGIAEFSGTFWGPAILSVALTLAVSQLSWWLVEQPSHRWLSRRERTATSPPRRAASDDVAERT